MHCCLFVVSLTAIGFYIMLSEIFFASWTYSCYLTLSEWQIILYLIALSFGILHGVFTIFQYGEISLLFFIILLCFYGLSIMVISRRYRKFRSAGGIHGNVDVLPRKKKTHKEKLLSNIESGPGKII